MATEDNAIKLVAPETEPAVQPVQEPAPETVEQANIRASKCRQELISVLKRYRCRIMQDIVVNKWYSDGQPMTQSTATYGVIPE